jgi:hypothetical protein
LDWGAGVAGIGGKQTVEHTFDTVDEKIAEAEFFLQRMAEVYTDMFAFNCFLSAYLSASRTTTLALQQFKHIPGFRQWYEPHRDRLRANRLAEFFLNMRNDHVHGGPYPVTGGIFHQGKACYHFAQPAQISDRPTEDVVSACRSYFVLLLEVVYDCYVGLGVHIDPQQYYTKEHFATKGRTIDDAEAEVLGWICTSLVEEGFDEDDRWQELRSRVDECKINHLFYSYLGKLTPEPKVPEHFHDFEYAPEDRGWICIPAGFTSIEDYRKPVKE